jgi:outer membrane receptor for ferrienterochelin and colicins
MNAITNPGEFRALGHKSCLPARGGRRYAANRMNIKILNYSLISRVDSLRAPALWLAAFLGAMLATSSALAADSTASHTNTDLTQVSLESLMQMEVPQISSASKFMQKETEAPASVTVISSDDIKRYGYRTLAQLLGSVPGLNVSYDRDYAYLGERGLSLGDFNSRTLLLVDGHRVNDNLTDGAHIDTSFILDMDLVDHVEIIQGPSAVLYGNNAFFGVINVVTRTGAQLNGVEASGEYGSFDTYKGRLTIGKSFTNGVDMLLSGSFYDSVGASKLFYSTYNTPAQNNGVAQGLDGDAYGDAFGSLKFGDFTLEGAFNRRVKDNPTAQFSTAFDAPGLRTIDDRGYEDLKFEHSFPNIVDVSADVYYDYVDHSIGYPFATAAKPLLYQEDQTGEWWGSELQLKKQLWDKDTFTLGAEYRDDFHQEDMTFNTATGKTLSDVLKTRQSYGVYAEGDVELLKQLHLNGGARYDQYGNFQPAYDPRVALIYDPFEKSTFKAIYGTAFRAPNFLELSDPRFQNISPENITSYELVYEQGIGRHLRSTVSGFYNKMEDLIVFENGKYSNINAESQGVELGLEGNWACGLRARASYTLQDAENDTHPGQSLPDSPKQLVKLNISVPIYEQKIFASLEFQYTSSRDTYSTTATGQTIPGLDVAGYNVVNFTLFSQNLIKNLDFSASIYNLFDEQYADPATPYHLQSQIPQNGRTFGVKLTYRF